MRILVFLCAYLAAVIALYGTKAVIPFSDAGVDELAELMADDWRISAMNIPRE